MEQAFRHKISIAPMIDITYEHFRVFFRLLTKNCVLYTEMIHENAINLSRVLKPFPLVLDYSQVEHPVVCQLGGNDPEKLAKAAQIAELAGFDEINLNVGCPSERVQDGAFGACLMKEPHLVAKCMKTMKEAVKIPCTVKCRLGVDNLDTYEFVRNFIEIVNKEGQVNHFIMHARKAFLKGLNPHENRTVPPLKYDWVYELKKEFPQINFTLNGGIKCTEHIDQVMPNVDGVMIGRTAHENPWIFSDFDRRYYGGENQNYNRKEILLLYAEFVEEKRANGCKVSTQMCVKPIINLFNGEMNNKKYRQFLSNTDNHKLGFRVMINQVIEHMQEWNQEALLVRPNDYKF
ncbi:unnamed protein product [Paramecium primaurelia]|uniref:tRNA-dihydrouridine synthase n=1 Tax=Paramecium primaurelia TaxID=5886 RepID=A0A8S1K3G7_PARPR|nr:unnamed protein product [Paramecium primaurelia]